MLNGFLQNKFQLDFRKIFQMDVQYFWLGPKGPIVGPEVSIKIDIWYSGQENYNDKNYYKFDFMNSLN